MIRGEFLKKPKFSLKVTVLASAIISTLALYQNCSDINLTPYDTSTMPSIISDSSYSTLPLPKEILGSARIVVVVDQSFSMVWNKCPSDLDGTSPSTQGSGFNACDRAPGVDQPGYRFDVINEWLNEIDLAGTTQDIKVMILPFSGGKSLRPHAMDVESPIHGLKDRDYMKFVNTLEARVWLDALRQEQQAMIEDGSQEIMGTTMFSPILEYARSQILTEIDLLKETDQLAVTPFRLTLISDGVYKPTMELFSKLRDVAGCPDCNQDRNHPACTCFSQSCNPGGGIPPGTYCRQIENNFKLYFGDPQINELANVVQILNDIIALQNRSEYNGFRFKMKFAKVNWFAVPDDDLNTLENKNRNIFDEIQKSFAKKVDTYNISTARAPFSILASSGSSLSYTIKNIYAINTNVFVNKFGKLVADSDGDGMSDEEELFEGTDPRNPRSNGICLDYIARHYGCQTIACDASLDRDRDGLNECEEQTLSSSPHFFDTDDDNIPDIFETLRGLNLKKDESTTYSAGDKFSDHIHFRNGVDSGVRIDSIPKHHLVDLDIEFKGFQTVQDGSSTNAVGLYKINLNNLPVLPTFSVPTYNVLQMKDHTNANIPASHRLDPLSKPANTNNIIFLMQVTTLENPEEIIWFVLKHQVLSAGQNSLNISLNLQNFTQLQGSD